MAIQSSKLINIIKDGIACREYTYCCDKKCFFHDLESHLEGPDVFGWSVGSREDFESYHLENWTISKVEEMSTEVILDQLSEYGVETSEEAFLLSTQG